MVTFYVLFLILLFVNVTHQSCEYSIIWKGDLCIYPTQIELNNSILPPNTPLCNIRHLSVLKLIQNDPPVINVLYSVRTEQEMRDCNITDPIESMSLSVITQFTLASGLYSFGQSYYFLSPLNNNTCLQLAFHLIANRSVNTCDLDQVCTPKQPIINNICNTQTVNTTYNVTSYSNTNGTSSTTKETSNTSCTANNNQSKPSPLPNSSNMFTTIALIILLTVILLSILTTLVCIVMASFYLYKIWRKRFMESINYEDEDYNYIPKELRCYLKSNAIRKEIKKEDIHVVIREDTLQIVQHNSLNQEAYDETDSSSYYDPNIKISIL